MTVLHVWYSELLGGVRADLALLRGAAMNREDGAPIVVACEG